MLLSRTIRATTEPVWRDRSPRTVNTDIRAMKQSTDRQVKLVQPQAVDSTTLRTWRPAASRRAVGMLLGHAAGSALNERLLVTVAGALAARGVASGTFNFAYRQAGRRVPDRADRLIRAFDDVLDAFEAQTEVPRTVVGGRSLGGRIATMLAAAGRGDGALALAYPLCPGGRRPPDPRRTAHWPRIAVPILFIHGDRDRWCPVDALDHARYQHLSDTAHSAHVVPGADHGLRVRARDARSAASVAAEIVDSIDGWLRATIEEGRDG